MTTPPNKKIRVFLRTRPTDHFASDMITLEKDEKTVHIHVPRRAPLTYVNNKREDWSFKLTKVLHNSSQTTVYREVVQGVIDQAFKGFNATVLAYGQTGAGKTYTITGATEIYEQRGMIPRAISQIFREVQENAELIINVRVSYLEIYNEQLRDLLADDSDPMKAELTVSDDGQRAIVKGIDMREVGNEEQTLSLLFEGEAKTTVGHHAINPASSRSHTIFTFYLECTPRYESGTGTFVSKVHFVDLAGSECAAKVMGDETSARESSFINRSLTFLEQVVKAASEQRRDHIPYRQTKLTHILRDSIGGNVNTVMVANIFAEPEYIEETIRTLKFSRQMMCVENDSQSNMKEDSQTTINNHQAEIARLKRELAVQNILAGRSAVSYEPYTATRRAELNTQIRRFIDGAIPEIPFDSVRRVQECFHIFRHLIRELEGKLAAADPHHALTHRTSGLPQQDKATSGQIPSKLNDLRGVPLDGSVRVRAEASLTGVGTLDTATFAVGVAPGDSYPPPAPKKTIPAKKKDGKFPPLTSTEPTDSPAPDVANDVNIHEMPLSQVFDEFKARSGAQLCEILKDNKSILRTKKQEARLVAAKLNEIKDQIDSCTSEMSAKQTYFDSNGLQVSAASTASASATSSATAARGQPQVLDQDVFTLAMKCKELKKRYRSLHEELNSINKDIDYCNHLVVECRKKLLFEFRIFYQSLGGSVDEIDFAKLEDRSESAGQSQLRYQLRATSANNADSEEGLFFSALNKTMHKVGPTLARRLSVTAPAATRFK